MAAGDGAPTNEAGAADTWLKRLRQSRNIVLELGAIAAALGSILGLVVFVLPWLGLTGGDDPKGVTTVLQDGAEITLAVEPAVERMTYGRWLEVETGSSEGSTEEDRRVQGVNVHYVAGFPAYARGAPFRARFTLKDQANATRHTHETEARLDADRDTCRCAEFVPVPNEPASYRVHVELFRPGAPYAAPVLEQPTDWFAITDPVSEG